MAKKKAAWPKAKIADKIVKDGAGLYDRAFGPFAEAIKSKSPKPPKPYKSWIDYHIKIRRQDALGQAAMRMGVL